MSLLPKNMLEPESTPMQFPVSNEIGVEIIGDIMRVTLHRPEAMNALTQSMLHGLDHAITSLQENRDLRVLVITGSGRAFCAGADLKAFDAAQAVAPGEPDFLDQASALFSRIAALPLPVIASLNGITMAGGGSLLRNLDRLISQETGLPVVLVDDPLSAVVVGSGAVLDQLDLLKDVIIQ